MAERITLSLWEPVQGHKAIQCGVYVIRCRTNGSFYIGSSRNIKQRLSRHFLLLRRNGHENKRLQNTFNKYGESAFFCEPLEGAREAEIYTVEQKWIDRFRGSGLLLNMQMVAGRPPTFHELPEALRERKRQKHMASTGRPASPKLLAFLSQRVGENNPNFGKKLAQSHIEKMRASFLASEKVWRSGEASPIFGLKRSAETRKAMSDAQKLRFQQGSVNGKSMPCRCIDKTGIVTVYASTRSASEARGLGLATVARWCRGARTPQDGCKWEYVHAG